jgi:CRP-like cAMP-binding protein
MRKIYEVMDFADSAYIMHKGKLIFELSPNDRYRVEGKEVIFGAEEPLIAYKSNMDEYYRFQTAYVEDDAVMDKIPLKNLYKFISTYNIGYGITRNIARYVNITNKIYINKEKTLSGKEMASKEFAVLYTNTIDRLKKTYEKLKVKWIRQIIDRFSNSLVYTKGLAFQKSTSKSNFKLQMDQLNEFTFNLQAGSILCEEGDKGNEMFILNHGSLEIYIAGKRVAGIHESGMVIGEMALLLGEKRTATVKTITDCNITFIKPENLKEVAQKNSDFFLNVAVNMGKRLEHNCNLIRETADLLAENAPSDIPLPPHEKINYKELLALIRELERYEIKYKVVWLTDLLNSVKDEITKTRTTFN